MADLLYIEIYVFTIHKFADLLYIENPKDVTRKLLELINEFGKFAGSEINTKKYLGFLYTKNKRSEREIKETIPFTIALKRIKYLGINIPKEVKELYSQNYKDTDERNFKNDTERYTILLDWENQCWENYYTTQSDLQLQCTPYQITNGFFFFLTELEQKITVYMEAQKIPNSQCNLEKEKQSLRNHVSWLQTILHT